MENKGLAIENILHLPNEVLSLIFQHLKDTLVIGQVCKRFYAIICGIRAVMMNFIDCKPDKKILDSVLNSGRKIEDLSFSSYSNALNKILKRVGQNIKEVRIEGNDEDEFSFKSIELLNLMPNLTVLNISNIPGAEEDVKVPKNFRLKLHHLKELNIFDANCVVQAFQRLPNDVLETLSIVCCYHFDASFCNQRNLKHVEVDRKAMECLQLQNTKLKSLSGYFHGLWELEGQDELVSLISSTPRSQDDVDFMCNGLTSLEELELWVGEDWFGEVNLDEMTELKNLKTLELHSSGRCLKTLKSESLDYLTFHGDFPADSEVIGLNCPNLTTIEVSEGSSSLDVSSIFLNFPKLKKFINGRDSHFPPSLSQ